MSRNVEKAFSQPFKVKCRENFFSKFHKETERIKNNVFICTHRLTEEEEHVIPTFLGLPSKFCLQKTSFKSNVIAAKKWIDSLLEVMPLGRYQPVKNSDRVIVCTAGIKILVEKLSGYYSFERRFESIIKFKKEFERCKNKLKDDWLNTSINKRLQTLAKTHILCKKFEKRLPRELVKIAEEIVESETE